MTLGCSVSEAQRRISSREFQGWRAFELVDPWWLPQRIDNAIALLCSVVHNVNVKKSSRKRPEAFLADYDKGARRVLRLLRPGKATPADELRAQFIAITRQAGGTVQTSAAAGGA